MTRIIALILALAFASPAVAAPHERTPVVSLPMPAACAPLPKVLATLTADGTAFVILPADDVDQFMADVVEPMFGKIEGVTTVIVAELNGRFVFGLEIAGCMTDPVAVPGVTALPTRLSGRQPDGSVWA